MCHSPSGVVNATRPRAVNPMVLPRRCLYSPDFYKNKQFLGLHPPTKGWRSCRWGQPGSGRLAVLSLVVWRGQQPRSCSLPNTDRGQSGIPRMLAAGEEPVPVHPPHFSSVRQRSRDTETLTPKPAPEQGAELASPAKPFPFAVVLGISSA